VDRRKLKDCAEGLGVSVNKDPRGTALINRYATPPVTGAPLLELDGEDRDAMWDYCKQDVVVLRAIWRRIGHAYDSWLRHQKDNDDTVERMNERGVPIDRISCSKAMRMLAEAEPQLVEESVKLCGLRPTQTQKLKEYFGTEDCRKETLEAALPTLTGEKRRVAKIRLEINKASIKKLESMHRMSARDGRVHGAFQNNGAGTGRLTSSKPQLQNMKRSSAPEGYFETLHSGRPMKDLHLNTSLASRGFIRAPEGKTLIGSDYGAIEARVVAWAADEKKLLEAFRRDAPVYRMFAARLYSRGIDEIVKGSDEYQSGKMGILAGQYGVGGVGIMLQAAGYGLYDLVGDEPRCWDIVNVYRNTMTKIVAHWAELEAGFEKAMLGEESEVGPYWFRRQGKFVQMVLPSGRPIWFLSPKKSRVLVQKTGRMRTELRFLGRLKNGKLGWQGIYGGKLCAYGGQGTAADIMLDGARSLESVGFEPIMSVHDEIVSMIDEDEAEDPRTLELYDQAICSVGEWAKDIPIVCEGWMGEKRYGKY
jgi:DNA polymerase